MDCLVWMMAMTGWHDCRGTVGRKAINRAVHILSGLMRAAFLEDWAADAMDASPKTSTAGNGLHDTIFSKRMRYPQVDGTQ
jgi:hypothetical protein